MSDARTGQRARGHGFESLASTNLESNELAATIVPASGARISSLFDRFRGHEWMWSAYPPEDRPCRHSVGDDFATSPLIGCDECVPTVGPYDVAGTSMPDHGEVWSRAWSSGFGDGDDAESFTTDIDLETVPLTFSRTARIDGNRLKLLYRTEYQGGGPIVPWLWSWHPLFVMPAKPRVSFEGVSPKARFENGDGVDPNAPAITTPIDDPSSPIRSMDLGGPGRSAKLFFDAETSGRVTVHDTESGAGLTVRWRGDCLHGLGLWINRGGWNGYQHFAIEPCTAPIETPADLAEGDSRIPPAQASWEIEVVTHAADEILED